MKKLLCLFLVLASILNLTAMENSHRTPQTLSKHSREMDESQSHVELDSSASTNEYKLPEKFLADITKNAQMLRFYQNWATVFGFVNGGILLYLGFKNLWNNTGNKIIGTSQCFLGAAGIITLVKMNRYISIIQELPVF